MIFAWMDKGNLRTRGFSGSKLKINGWFVMKKILKSCKGITLLEIMSVVVILGVVASMAVPRFQIAVERLKFRAANREITNSLRLARSQAIAEKVPYGVQFDFWQGTVTVFKDSIVDAANPYVMDSGDPVFKTENMPPEVRYLLTDLANNVIIFNPNGSASFSGYGNISVHGYSESGGLYEHYHNILPATGRIRSYDSYREWAANHAQGTVDGM